MRRPILAVACKNHELADKLAESIAALENGARFVDPATLPSDATLVAVHAQLARLIREGLPLEDVNG